ncbi:4c810b13-d3d1-4626-acd8-513defa6fcaa [Sclerotinia trifoliorum]|uniref:4c810b13-d3d1-4626-acd8-513defa6fcaa n=1 Tax=Sclerotinia trifoliorum TaxID=28548 RepID=A0A8H2VTA5_9HELO|nr:4c810b13-d3d1-4626-acd8-513defa6fcaa [Sclerotinia trifoliorum]
MSTPSPTSSTLAPPRVDHETFTGVAWGGTALSFLFVVFRISVRVRTFKRLSPDDLCVIAAWLLLLSSAIVWQNIIKDMFELLAAGRVNLHPLPEGFETRAQNALRDSAAFTVLFYSTLWLIKLSFLLFFGRLLENVDSFIWPRRIVIVFVLATWTICIGTIPYPCMVPSFAKIVKECASSSATSFYHFTLAFNCSMDVLTDIMIMAIPFCILWTVRLSRKKKLAFAGIFSLAVITMIFAIVRVAVNIGSPHSTLFDQSWLYTWSLIEQTVAIIVACLASFRSLFARNNISQPAPPDPHESYQNDQNRQRKKRLFDVHFGLLSRLTAPSTYADITETTSRGTASEDVLLHSQKINMRQDVELQSSELQAQAT